MEFGVTGDPALAQFAEDGNPGVGAGGGLARSCSASARRAAVAISSSFAALRASASCISFRDGPFGPSLESLAQGATDVVGVSIGVWL